MGISSALGSSALLPAGLGFRNKIINGDFRIWQRGTSITTSGAYTTDRWAQVSGNSIVHTQSTDTPNAGFAYSLSMSGTGTNICQRIESLNCGGINGTITVSFWYKSTVGSDALSFALYTCNTTDSFGSVTQVGSNITVASSPSSSWTYYLYTFNGVSSNAKNGVALYIFRGSGATSTTLITGVQVEANVQPTPFEQRPYGVELALCQRYYQRFNAQSAYGYFGSGTATSTTNVAGVINLLVPFRAVSAVAPVYSNVGAGDGQNAPLTISAMSLDHASTNTCLVNMTVTGATQYRPYFPMANNNSSAYIAISSEL